MTLENAVKAIMKDTQVWIRACSGNESKLIINFPSVFLHYCGVLKTTQEFSTWGKLKFLKNRNLQFDFENGKLKRLYFNNFDGDSNISKLNKLIVLEMSTNTELEVIQEEKEFFNINTLNNFKF